MKIKYEPVFGPQELFDGAPDDVEVLRFNDYSKEYLRGDLNTVKLLTFKELKAIPIVAMRRIIKAPVWTMEDQKAGRLPDVGCRVNFCLKLTTNWRTGEIKYIDDQVAVIKVDAVDRHFVYEVDRVEFKPIESPEEKAQRLEDEWVNKAFGKTPVFGGVGDDENNRLRTHLRHIYMAQLSGDLPVPVKGE